LAEGERGACLWLLDIDGGRTERVLIPGFASCAHGSLDRSASRLAFDTRESPAGTAAQSGQSARP
jgi:hypothetical protein